MTVATPPQLTTLLSTLTTSLKSTQTSLPTSLPQSAAGISLLDLKNDVFLSYMHHLSYLLLFRIRNGSLKRGDSVDDQGDDGEELVKKLAELRVWLEKGVKPCENKLKYQIEKVLKAAGEWEREEARKAAREEEDEDEDMDKDEEDDDEDDDDEDEEEEGSDEEITSEEDKEDLPKTVNYDSDDLSKPKSKRAGDGAVTMKNALSYRPNPSALSKPSNPSLSAAADGNKKDGIYRPPKLNPVSMPVEATTTANERGEKRDRKQKSRVLDEYLAESSAAPIAEPSIGSNVSRKGKTATMRERAAEKERRDYEESNFVRLPKLSKKEQKDKNRRDGGAGDKREWGGEDWSSLSNSMGLDRIERLTKRKSDDGGRGALGRSRKRGGDDNGFGGGGGAGIGERWEKRRKTVDRDRRKRNK